MISKFWGKAQLNDCDQKLQKRKRGEQEKVGVEREYIGLECRMGGRIWGETQNRLRKLLQHSKKYGKNVVKHT